MDRICYCPSEEEIKQAEELAEPWGIPIQIGDSEKTSVLEFDRSLTQILQVPTRQYLHLSSANLRVNTALLVNYKDEFNGTKGCWVEIHLMTNVPHKGNVFEKIQATPTANEYTRNFRIRPRYIGDYELRIVDKDGVIATDNFTVRR